MSKRPNKDEIRAYCATVQLPPMNLNWAGSFGINYKLVKESEPNAHDPSDFPGILDADFAVYQKINDEFEFARLAYLTDKVMHYIYKKEPDTLKENKLKFAVLMRKYSLLFSMIPGKMGQIDLEEVKKEETSKLNQLRQDAKAIVRTHWPSFAVEPPALTHAFSTKLFHAIDRWVTLPSQSLTTGDLQLAKLKEASSFQKAWDALAAQKESACMLERAYVWNYAVNLLYDLPNERGGSFMHEGSAQPDFYTRTVGMGSDLAKELRELYKSMGLEQDRQHENLRALDAAAEQIARKQYPYLDSSQSWVIDAKPDPLSVRLDEEIAKGKIMLPAMAARRADKGAKDELIAGVQPQRLSEAMSQITGPLERQYVLELAGNEKSTETAEKLEWHYGAEIGHNVRARYFQMMQEAARQIVERQH